MLHELDTDDIEEILKVSFEVLASSELGEYLTGIKKTKELKEKEKMTVATNYSELITNLEQALVKPEVIFSYPASLQKFGNVGDSFRPTLYSVHSYLARNPSKKIQTELIRSGSRIVGIKLLLLDTAEKSKPTTPTPAPVRYEKDADYFYTPSEKEILEVAIKRSKNVYIAGPTGVGKTELATRVCNALGRKYYRVNFDGEFSKADFTGDWVLAKDPDDRTSTIMMYNDGILPTAMKEGAVLILDEFDAAPPEILFTLQSVLEGKPLMNTKNTETVLPASGFCIIATANTVGKGDLSSFYAGTRLMNQATLDRFHYVIRMDYLPEKIEREILMRRTGCEEKLAKNVITFMNNARKAASGGSLFETFSLRKAINLCDAIEEDRLSLKLAFKATVLDRASEEDAIKVKELAQRIWTEVV